jgi:hypothetical protein
MGTLLGGDREVAMALVNANIWATGDPAEHVFSKMIDAMIGAVIKFMKTIRSVHNKKIGIAAS